MLKELIIKEKMSMMWIFWKELFRGREASAVGSAGSTRWQSGARRSCRAAHGGEARVLRATHHCRGPQEGEWILNELNES